MGAITYNFEQTQKGGLPVSFYSANDRHDQRDVRRPDGYTHDQLLLAVDGRGTVTCQGKTYELRRGTAFFVGRGVTVEYLNGGGLVTAFLTLRGSGLRALLEYYGCTDFLYREAVSVSRFTEDVREIIHIYRKDGECGTLSAKVLAFIAGFFEQKQERPTAAEEVAAYVRRHFGERLTLDRLAAVGSCSVSKLCHDFKKQYGCTVIRYVLDFRLRCARDLLRSDPDKSVREIAGLCGFEDVGYFCRAYKQQYGKTPTESRKTK
ncbi:MAG: helix-turn-helix transcriptional regulator [Clostridia bacterium]|nr:helix-turn-helix transcriptional regulator [Clostridia bacterium]